jgi:hypothetical protein
MAYQSFWSHGGKRELKSDDETWYAHGPLVGLRSSRLTPQLTEHDELFPCRWVTWSGRVKKRRR